MVVGGSVRPGVVHDAAVLCTDRQTDRQLLADPACKQVAAAHIRLLLLFHANLLLLSRRRGVPGWGAADLLPWFVKAETNADFGACRERS